MHLQARRILLCLRYGIGDVVMELPVMEALREAVPGAHITALGAMPATQLLEDHPALDEVANLDRWGIMHRWDCGPAGAQEAIGEWVAEHDFDLYLDVHHAPPVVGEAVWTRGVRSLESDEQAEREAVRRGADAVGAIKEGVRVGWGLEVPQQHLPRLPLRTAEREFADYFLRSCGADGHTPIGLAPVASLELKRWPIGRFAAVADRILDETPGSLLAFCGPDEELGTALRAEVRHGDHVHLVGALHLRRVAALLERCRIFLCNDTGLMHLAGALDVPTVAVFGPTAPSIYRPSAGSVVSVGGEAVPCPHRNTDSLHPPGCWSSATCLLAGKSCIHDVEVTAVLRAVRSRLDECAGDAPRLASVK